MGMRLLFRLTTGTFNELDGDGGETNMDDTAPPFPLNGNVDLTDLINTGNAGDDEDEMLPTILVILGLNTSLFLRPLRFLVLMGNNDDDDDVDDEDDEREEGGAGSDDKRLLRILL